MFKTQKLKNKTPREAVLYITINLPEETKTNQTALKKLLFETQGEAVELQNTKNIVAAMRLLALIHKTSPELVYRMENGEQILIFDHNFTPVIRSKNINTNFVISDKKPDKNKLEKHQTIDVEKIWKSTDGSEFLDHLEKAWKELKKEIYPAEKITLQGIAPTVLFLLAEHGLWGKSKEIWYQQSMSSKPILIRLN